MRINFEANDALVDMIDSLAERTGSTKKGVIIGALQILQWSLDQQDEGRTIAAVSSTKGAPVKEFHSPMFAAGGTK